MSPFVGFLAFLVVTLAFLGGAVATGFAAKRRVHLPLVAGAVASLLTTIWFAEKLGHAYDLESAGRIYPVHLFLAKATTLLYLLPIASGVATIRNPRVRPWHRRIAFLVIALTVVTAVTGTWMLLAADPI
jgi:F0F1-type ATP synthase membrane subunit c/vacuolar-type H+-ATPase subunit K